MEPTKEQLVEEARRNIGGMGWKKDQLDARDWRFRSKFGLADISALPKVASIKEHFPPVRGQRDLGACTGFAASAAVGYLRRTDADLHSTIYSPLFAYFVGRMIDNNIAYDDGAYLRDVIKGIVDYGICPESRWQYYDEQRRFAHRPPDSAWKSALRWRLGGYYRCNDWTDVFHALSLKHPVVLGFPCYASMFTSTVTRTGDIPFPRLTNDSLLGHHAVVAHSYDMERPDWKLGFQNSWEDTWGNGGHGTLPIEMVKRSDMVSDMWALVSEA